MNLIDFREVAKRQDFAGHAEIAETYFRPFPFDCRLMHKPFMSDAEAAEICAGLGVLLPQLHLFAGIRVLDFGAGTCWLSRILALLGCDVTAVDVSSHALALGRRLMESDPHAAKMQVKFVRLESDHLPFAGATFERIVCFDALHHVPDQTKIIAEFARVLQPGGIAAFHEPGPHHSRTPQSQHEMRMHGVIEGDIDVPALEVAARAAEFDDCRVALFGPVPQMLKPAGYEAFIEGTNDPAVEREALRQMRATLQGKRIFFMNKGDWRANLDSRSQEGLQGTLDLSAELAVDGLKVSGRATNTGNSLWLPSAAEPGGVRLGVHLHDAEGRLILRGHHYTGIIEAPLAPGGSVEIEAIIPLPSDHAALHLTFDLVASEVTWFEVRGCRAATFKIDLKERRLLDVELQEKGESTMVAEPDMAEATVTEDAVKWAYRLILGREAENEDVIEDQLRTNMDWQTLRRNFLSSPEFQESLPPRSPLSLRGDEPPLRIDCEGSPEDMQRLFRHVNQSWLALGESDPFYSVLTSPEYRGLPADKAISIFFDSGAGDARLFMRALERNKLDLATRRTCLEFGCGIGRITQALAPRFEKTIAVDISAAHLALAEKYARDKGIRGIDWVHLDSVGSLDRLPPIDVIYSMMVLQHNPPPIIDRIVSTFARILKPGGIAYFQVPTHRIGYEFDLREYVDSTVGNPGMEMHVYPQDRVFRHFDECGALPVSVVEDEATGFKTGVRSNTFLFLRKMHPGSAS